MSDEEIFREKFYNAGITIPDLVFALYKKVAMDDPADLDSLHSFIIEATGQVEV